MSDQNLHLQKLLFKIKNCPDFETLYCFEEEFNNVGLTLQSTIKDRMILCTIVEGSARAKKVLEDYMFVGSISNKSNELSPRFIECLCNFVMENHGKESKVVNVPRKWQNGTQTYGQVVIVNEDVEDISQDMIIG